MPDTNVHTIYKKKDGTRVPSVTTCLSVLGKPAIIHWAWECGVAGLDYRKVRDAAGDTGSLVHYLILCQLKREEPNLSTYSPQVVASTASPMNKFNRWLAEHKLEPILLETPLVSEIYGFGGTPDFYGRIDGQLTGVDFKTGKEVYQEQFYQLAASEMLFIENGYPVDVSRILRLGKSEDEGFEDRVAGNLVNHWGIFLACRDIYELRKKIRRTEKEEN